MEVNFILGGTLLWIMTMKSPGVRGGGRYLVAVKGRLNARFLSPRPVTIRSMSVVRDGYASLGEAVNKHNVSPTQHCILGIKQGHIRNPT